MIDVSYLIANLDEILGENMFLKDAAKADSLKGSVHAVFNEIEQKFDCIENQLNYTTNQTYTDMEELIKTKDALKQYLKGQVDLSRQLLSSLGEWY